MDRKKTKSKSTPLTPGVQRAALDDITIIDSDSEEGPSRVHTTPASARKPVGELVVDVVTLSSDDESHASSSEPASRGTPAKSAVANIISDRISAPVPRDFDISNESASSDHPAQMRTRSSRKAKQESPSGSLPVPSPTTKSPPRQSPIPAVLHEGNTLVENAEDVSVDVDMDATGSNGNGQSIAVQMSGAEDPTFQIQDEPVIEPNNGACSEPVSHEPNSNASLLDEPADSPVSSTSSNVATGKRHIKAPVRDAAFWNPSEENCDVSSCTEVLQNAMDDVSSGDGEVAVPLQVGSQGSNKKPLTSSAVGEKRSRGRPRGSTKTAVKSKPAQENKENVESTSEESEADDEIPPELLSLESPRNRNLSIMWDIEDRYPEDAEAEIAAFQNSPVWHLNQSLEWECKEQERLTLKIVNRLVDEVPIAFRTQASINKFYNSIIRNLQNSGKYAPFAENEIKAESEDPDDNLAAIFLEYTANCRLALSACAAGPRASNRNPILENIRYADGRESPVESEIVAYHDVREASASLHKARADGTTSTLYLKDAVITVKGRHFSHAKIDLATNFPLL